MISYNLLRSSYTYAMRIIKRTAPSFRLYSELNWKAVNTATKKLTVFNKARFFIAFSTAADPNSSNAASVGTKNVADMPPEERSRASLPVITNSIAWRNVLLSREEIQCFGFLFWKKTFGEKFTWNFLRVVVNRQRKCWPESWHGWWCE